MSEDDAGSTGDLGVFGPVRLLVAAAVLLAVVAGFGWLFVVSWLGVPWEIGFPLSLLAGLAMLAWGESTRWRLVSAALWAVGIVWLVVWWVR